MDKASREQNTAGNLLDNILLFVCIVLLLATPYHLSHGLIGPTMSSLYSWVAAGVLIGVAANYFLADFAAKRVKHLEVLQKCALGIGCALSAMMVISEWIGLYWYQGDTYEVSLLSDLGLREHWLALQHWLLLIAATCCSFTLLRCAYRYSNDVFDDVKASDRVLRCKAYGLVSLISLLVGISIRAIWIWIYPYSGMNYHPYFFHPSYWWLNIIPVLLLLLILLRSRSLLNMMNVKHLFSIVLSGCSFGVVIYSASIRVIPLYRSDQTWVGIAAFVFLVFVCLLIELVSRRIKVGFLASQSAQSEDGPISQSGLHSVAAEEACDCSFIQQLDSCALSIREREVVEQTIQGLSSSEIAERLEVASSTVRNTLSRAYVKIGVDDKKQLLNQFQNGKEQKPSLPIEKDLGIRSSQNSSNKRSVLWVLLLFVLFLVFVVAGFPHTFESEEWGLGRQIIFGYAIGMLSVGFVTISVGIGAQTLNACVECSNLLKSSVLLEKLGLPGAFVLVASGSVMFINSMGYFNR